MPFFPDFKYFDLIRPMPPSGRPQVTLKSPCLKEVANAWNENMWRTSSFCLFPSEIAATALHKQLWRDYAVFKVTGKLTLKEKRFSEKIEKAISKEVEKCKEAWKEEFFSSGMNAASERRLTIGVEHINLLLKTEMGAMQSMTNILYSVVIESWTAFETLAGDLWYIALDRGLAEWRKRAGLRYDKPRATSDSDSSTIDVATIADPQNGYGSFLRDSEKVPFQKLPNIKTAYGTVFGKQIQRKLFAKDAYIDALSAVRNVITHKAGIADRKYVEAVKTFPELNTVPKNKSIGLDGQIVRKLRNSAIIVGNELVMFLDEQLSNRAKP
ncbi:MAG TPA: hypothetical protein VEP30_10670 [Chthoniobacterales bacterium]|nr:hypothetical protein [Chthoniobacterales bacterium]